MSEVQAKIRPIIRSHLGVEESAVTPEAYLRDDLNAGTLALAEIVMDLEEQFKITIPQDDLSKFETVGDIETYISEHLNEL